MVKPRFTDSHKFKRPYRSSVDTNIAATFEAILREQRKNAEEVEAKVQPMQRKKANG